MKGKMIRRDPCERWSAPVLGLPSAQLACLARWVVEPCRPYSWRVPRLSLVRDQVPAVCLQLPMVDMPN